MWESEDTRDRDSQAEKPERGVGGGEGRLVEKKL